MLIARVKFFVDNFLYKPVVGSVSDFYFGSGTGKLVRIRICNTPWM